MASALHADQFNLTPDELASDLERTIQFIADLQSIYRTTAPPP